MAEVHLVAEEEVLVEDKEKVNFIKSSKQALNGSLFGMIAPAIIPTILVLLATLIIDLFDPALQSNEIYEQVVNEISKMGFAYSLLANFTYILILLGLILIIKRENFYKILRSIKDVFKSKKKILYALGGVIAIILFSLIYNFIMVDILKIGAEISPNQEEVESFILLNPFFGFVAVCIFAPLWEEIAHRYCLFGGLYKKNKVLAYIVSALIFMAGHAIFSIRTIPELLTLPPYAISGVVLCYIYEKTDNLGTSITAHFTNNFISYVLIMLSSYVF